MKPILALAFAVSLLTMSASGSGANAQQSPSDDDDADAPAYMMGPGMMGPRGMMGFWNSEAEPHDWGGRWGGHRGARCGMMAAHIDGRLAYAKAELKITEAQEHLWDAYAGAAHDRAQAMTSRCTAMMGGAGAGTSNLLERMDQREQFMAAQLDALRAMNAAMKPLYDSFSDSQKQVADRLFWGPMGMM
jgi:hypothetical protein